MPPRVGRAVQPDRRSVTTGRCHHRTCSLRVSVLKALCGGCEHQSTPQARIGESAVHTSDIAASRSIDSTIVRTSCERGTISAAVGLGNAAEAYGYAVVIARHATSERHLAAFIRDQIDGRETAVERQ